ncbi:putative protein phosphatase 2C 14 [Nicotiana tabacum]|uniref:protein-serine/threonine phosphatase n=2 Tax=Nicotiana TaxID=4085 RepID=A0A1S4CW71_TOBAC|nr:PREDICTED: probable protein phosphatase 2C 14 isoform X1 [Nicotiana sylvestris]XP_016505358.1 PREDICTED: probable protein phosphatase 2C 14 isoform X1 [Nicotiana tabacum]
MQKGISTTTVMNDNNNIATTDENQNINADSFCSLKRKRPPKIEIPSLLCEIRVNSEPCFKNDAAVTKHPICFSGHGVGLFCRKGKKTIMEDTHKIISSSNVKRGFFGVYDGHGGRKAAEFVAENLHSYVFEMLDNGSSTTREKAIEAAYLKTDQRFLKQGLGSGVCCITALIEGKEIIVSNLGDCRAVLCRSGVAEALTIDHRAEREDERKRIEDKGGYVELHRGGWRVHGVLSVTRSIGDSHLKDWVPAKPDTKTLILAPDMEYLVLASDGLWDEVGNQEAVDIIMQYCPREKRMQLPVEKGKEFYCLSRSPSKLRRVPIIKSNRRKSHSPCCKKSVNSEDEFGNENESPPKKARRVSTMNQTKMMKMKIQEKSGLNKKQPSNALVAACRELVNLAVSRGSWDDITVMIIDLSHFKC